MTEQPDREPQDLLPDELDELRSALRDVPAQNELRARAALSAALAAHDEIHSPAASRSDTPTRPMRPSRSAWWVSAAAAVVVLVSLPLVMNGRDETPSSETAATGRSSSDGAESPVAPNRISADLDDAAASAPELTDPPVPTSGAAEADTLAGENLAATAMVAPPDLVTLAPWLDALITRGSSGPDLGCDLDTGWIGERLTLESGDVVEIQVEIETGHVRVVDPEGCSVVSSTGP